MSDDSDIVDGGLGPDHLTRRQPEPDSDQPNDARVATDSEPRTRQMSKTVRVLRWIAVAPMALIAPGIICPVFLIVCSLGLCSMLPIEVFAVPRSEGFGGHYIMGPMVIACISYIGGSASVLGAALAAPSHKRETSFIIAGMTTACTIILLMFWYRDFRNPSEGPEPLPRLLVELVPWTLATFISAAFITAETADARDEAAA